MKTFIFYCLLLFTLKASAQHSFDAGRLSQNTRLKVDSIVSQLEGYEYIYFDYGESSLSQRLNDSTSVEELILLTDHPAPLVRCIAFQLLSQRKGVALLPILVKHISDTAKIKTVAGCIGNNEQVGDVFINQVVFGGSSYMYSSIPKKQLAVLDSILTYTDNSLRARAAAIRRMPRNNHLYKRLQVLVGQGDIPSAPEELLKFRKERDIPLVLRYRNIYSVDSGFSDICNAIQAFPHPDFFPFLEVQAKNIGRNDDYYTGRRELYFAIASYKSAKAASLLLIPFSAVKDSNERFHHLYSVFAALDFHYVPFYDSIFWRLWEDSWMISYPVYLRLRKADPQRAMDLSIQTLQQFRAQFGFTMWMYFDPTRNIKKLIGAMLDNYIRYDRKAAMELCRDLLGVADCDIFEFLVNKSISLREPFLLQAIPIIIEQRSDRHCLLGACKPLIALKDKALNKELRRILVSQDGYKDTWMYKELLELLDR